MDLFRKKSVDQLAAESTPLKRTMHTFDLTMLGIGAIIGTGIFVLTGKGALTAGPALMVSPQLGKTSGNLTVALLFLYWQTDAREFEVAQCVIPLFSAPCSAWRNDRHRAGRDTLYTALHVALPRCCIPTAAAGFVRTLHAVPGYFSPSSGG